MTHQQTATRAFTCPHFVAIAGTHRCQDYLPNGGCKRPDEFMCVEWLKLNGPPSPIPDANTSPQAPSAPVARDLFGIPVAPCPPKHKGRSSHPSTEPRTRPPSHASPLPRPSLASEPRRSAGHELPSIRSVTEADVTSFRERGLEVCVESEPLGELWLVPTYTGQDRQELTIEHAALLAAVGAVFPEARITSLRRPSRDAELDRNDMAPEKK